MSKRPEDMTPQELRAFVRAALVATKRRPLPEDVRRWYEATTKVTDQDLRRVLR